jgi:beta-xylosidase
MTLMAAAESPWTADLGNGEYRNPILFADYSDPDVVRVGEDYWLTSSSFGHVPGLPILHSRDLVNWTLVNHALPALVPAGHFSVPRHGAGVWAPAIRHHDGKFWIYYPDPDFGIYVVTAADPRARWSAPVLVKAGKGLIDPCPFWDTDGKLYLVHGWARSRAGKANLLTLNELSPDGMRITDGDGTVIIDENTTGRGLSTLEGPKLYRRDDEYWIFAPVNGVTHGSQAAYRAKNIRGPYEVRLVLAQGSTVVNGPHQGAWVDTPSGENWFVHFQDNGPYGRVVHLQPMIWGKDGWPHLGTAVDTGAECGEPVLVHRKPAMPPGPIAAPATSDEFNAPQPGPQWQWQANPQATWASLASKPGFLRLAAVPRTADAGLYDAPNLYLQKFPAPSFTATTVLDAAALGENAEAGLIVFGYGFAWIGLRRDGQGLYMIYAEDLEHVPRPAPAAGRIELVDGAFHVEVVSTTRGRPTKVYLRVSVDAAARCTFASSTDGEHFTPVFAVAPGHFQATVGHWVGAKVGVFASAPASAKNPGHADFDWFHVAP